MDETPKNPSGSAYDHLCPLVVSLGGMGLYFMEHGKARWAKAARDSADEILKLRIEREWMRLIVRLLSQESASTATVRNVLSDFIDTIDDERDRAPWGLKKYRNAYLYGAGVGRLGRLADGEVSP